MYVHVYSSTYTCPMVLQYVLEYSSTYVLEYLYHGTRYVRISDETRVRSATPWYCNRARVRPTYMHAHTTTTHTQRAQHKRTHEPWGGKSFRSYSEQQVGRDGPARKCPLLPSDDSSSVPTDGGDRARKQTRTARTQTLEHTKKQRNVCRTLASAVRHNCRSCFYSNYHHHPTARPRITRNNGRSRVLRRQRVRTQNCTFALRAPTTHRRRRR